MAATAWTAELGAAEKTRAIQKLPQLSEHNALSI